jgi:FAD/FMN-containing dehydrogenase
MSSTTDQALEALACRLGPQGLWRRPTPGSADASSFNGWPAHERDWRGRYHGQALAIARPASLDEVVFTVQQCAKAGIPVVPQGGNTSLVGGSVPDHSGQQLVLNLQRLNRVLAVDTANLSMTVEAGCLLAAVQDAARAHRLLFPLSLAAEGSCTIGGNLATNAGGTQVLRYGTARELCLGLQVVTAEGEVLDQLTALRKNNTGYDLRDLFVGSEGTLGVITAATLRLHPLPRGTATCLLPCTDLAAAVTALASAREHLDAGLTAFEVMAALPLQLLQTHTPEAATPLNAWLSLPAWALLIEHQSATSADTAQQQMLQWLGTAANEVTGVHAEQALMAQNEAQAQALWAVREHIPLAEKAEGLMVKHDIGLPTSAIPEFVHTMQQAIPARWPGARIVCFGHLGDGNLHFNVQPPEGQRSPEGLAAFEPEVNSLVFDAVGARAGTISAEHGIGALRARELERRASPVAVRLMRAIRHALDAKGLFNPGRMLP